MRKPSNTLLEAMDQMEQIPGIAGVWSEVRCQTRHTKPMRKTDWAFITSSGWLYVNTEREASCPEWVYILSHCCLHLALGHIREDRKTDAVWEHACDCIAAKMLLDLRIGRPPAEFAEAPPANAKEETAFYHWLLEHPTVKIPRFATMTDGRTGMIFDWLPSGQDWARLLPRICNGRSGRRCAAAQMDKRHGHARAARQSWQGRGFFPAIRCWGPSQRGSA